MKEKIYIVVYRHYAWAGGYEEVSLLKAFEDYEKAKIFTKEKQMELTKEDYVEFYGLDKWDRATNKEKEEHYEDCDFRVSIETLTVE